MAPKKKGNKKADDDWEAEALGDSSDPIALATQQAKAADAVKDDDDAVPGGGGLLAAIKKNRQNKKKKGKVVEESFSDGEDTEAVGVTNGLTPNDFEATSRAPEEATADDFFDAPATKEKAARGGASKKDAAPTEIGDESEVEAGGLKSKKEKEKEKKERMKQRKKEQVRVPSYSCRRW